jgi:hypothetical protein
VRYIFILLLIIGCANNSDGRRNDPVFLIAGQSNSVSPAQGDISSCYSTEEKVFVNDFYSDNHPKGYFGTELRIPTQNNPMKGGCVWIYLGDLFNRKVTFNIVGEGGTSTRQWIDYYHEGMVNALKARYYDAIIWVQGESDQGLGISEDETYNNMLALINESRQIQPGIIWYVALDGMSVNLDGNPRKAQLRLINEHIVKQGVDIDELRKNRPSCFDSRLVHFSGSIGLHAHAQSWYDILKNDF